MSVYNWESNPRAHKKKAKKSGTVILHPQGDLDTSFARFLKPQPVFRANPFGIDSDHAHYDGHGDEEDDEIIQKDAGDAAKRNALPADGEPVGEETVNEEDGKKTGVQPHHPKSEANMPLMTTATVERLRNVFEFTELLPSQAQCYKGVFIRRDVILHSRTGSGKTLAYALPIVERYLLFKAKMRSLYPDEPYYQDHVDATTDGKQEGKKEADKTSNLSCGPFLLIFVFSIDLAVQTKMVLCRLYPQLRIEVPCCTQSMVNAPSNEEERKVGKGEKHHKNAGATLPDTASREMKAKKLSSELNGSALQRADILVGTVHAIDGVIRGHRLATEALQAEEKEAASRFKLIGKNGSHQKRGRINEEKDENGKGSSRRKKTKIEENKKGTQDSSLSLKQKAHENEEEEDEESESSSEDVDEDDSEEEMKDERKHSTPSRRNAPFEGSVVSAARVQAIVIDEVDTTLGPRFSSLGRRMKNLLKYIRKSNGALNPDLLTDYRCHHYVLCGATIPNWVIKAGFLGVKKYYYRLVQPGAQKLPHQLSCYYLPCPLTVSSRVLKVQELLSQNHAVGKETGETSKNKGSSPNLSSNTFLGRVVVFGSNREIEALSTALSASSSSAAAGKGAGRATVFTLTARLPEADRMAAIAGFNDSGSASATLLCTDIAARGLDVAGADTILMMSLPLGPMAAETFIHRAGRTARVGRQGRCIVLLADAAGSSHASKTSSSTLSTGGHAGSGTSLHYTVGEERNSYERIVQAAHITFQHFGATLGGNVDQRARLQLEVRRPFWGPPRSGAPSLPTAREVLEKELTSSTGSGDSSTESLMQLVEDIKEDDKKPAERIFFSVPTAKLHLIQKKLWKYDLKEL